MNYGKTVFIQIMQFTPRRDFNDKVTGYNGDYHVGNLPSHGRFLVMRADQSNLLDIGANLNALALIREQTVVFSDQIIRLNEEPSYYIISQAIGTMSFEKIPVPELIDKPNLYVSFRDGQFDLYRDLQS